MNRCDFRLKGSGCACIDPGRGRRLKPPGEKFVADRLKIRLKRVVLRRASSAVTGKTNGSSASQVLL